MKMYTLIKKYCLAATLLGSMGAHAAFVDIAGPDTNSIQKKVVGTYSKATTIEFSQNGNYQINYKDLGLVPEFALFGAAISQQGTSVVDLVLNDGSLQGAKQFSLLKGTYDLNIFAITNIANNFGEFKLEVNPVPLPSAVIFLSSALMGLIAFCRRRKIS
jgi:hypothetical protein